MATIIGMAMSTVLAVPLACHGLVVVHPIQIAMILINWAWADAEEILILVGNADCGWEFNYYAYAEGDIRTISGEEVLILADAVASVTDPLRVERGGAARVDETLSDGSGFHDFAAPVDSDTVMVGSVMLNSGARITGAHTIVTLTTAGGDFDRGHAHADAKAGVDFWINLP